MLRQNEFTVIADSSVSKPLPAPKRVALFAPLKVNTLKVLILEQNISASEQHEATLKDYAWKSAHTAETIDEGLRLAIDGAYDVAILDAMVGGQGTFEVASAASKRGIPIVLCTNGDGPTYPAYAEKLRNVIVLKRPALGEKLRAVLKQADLRRGGYAAA
jgi:DNA-binding response OmpR family regulator